MFLTGIYHAISFVTLSGARQMSIMRRGRAANSIYVLRMLLLAFAATTLSTYGSNRSSERCFK